MNGIFEITARMAPPVVHITEVASIARKELATQIQADEAKKAFGSAEEEHF